jgi:exodeoxyribonuclease-3
LARTAVAAGTDREPAEDRRMSDHAPVVVDYDI